MTTPIFSPLNDNERAWIQKQLDSVTRFIDAFSPADNGQPVNLAVLDRAYARWISMDIHRDYDVNATINIIGIRFGQFLVDELGFRWTIATDGDASDLAVLALPGRGDVVVYPANFVAKRWEKRESNFLAAAFDWIRDQKTALEADWSGNC